MDSHPNPEEYMSVGALEGAQGSLSSDNSTSTLETGEEPYWPEQIAG